MNCFYCGAELAPSTFFCPECGRRVSDEGTPAEGGSGFYVDPLAFEPPPADEDIDHTQDFVDETASLQLTQPASRPFVLVSTTGQRFEVRGRSLLGRNPVADPAVHYEAVLVVVDPGKTISKSHAELLIVADELLVIDLHSGNGTVVETPGQRAVKCIPGMPQPVRRGSRLVLGRQAIDVE
ncbi:MAG: FHA domain-containing protein [Microbacteriaceae bacterium]|nr:FHA domain-containing protein [Microbacteriaceae bacterium]